MVRRLPGRQFGGDGDGDECHRERGGGRVEECCIFLEIFGGVQGGGGRGRKVGGKKMDAVKIWKYCC